MKNYNSAFTAENEARSLINDELPMIIKKHNYDFKSFFSFSGFFLGMLTMALFLVVVARLEYNYQPEPTEVYHFHDDMKIKYKYNKDGLIVDSMIIWKDSTKNK